MILGAKCSSLFIPLSEEDGAGNTTSSHWIIFGQPLLDHPMLGMWSCHHHLQLKK
jgi:hypothetical protein